jgi:flavodoxin I
MKALIVYDSFFGNTEQIAQAICEALGPKADVETFRVGDVKPEQLAGVELLIVGSPTRAFRPTPAITSFLKRIPKNGLEGVKVAAFDTGLAMDDIGSPILRFLVRLFGYAATPISNRLKRKGGEVVAPPEGFFVTGAKGPLKEGELERATDWGKRIVATG